MELAAETYVVIHHCDDVGLRDAVLPQNLVCVADISMMAIIHVGMGAANQNSPMSCRGGAQQKGKENEGLHGNKMLEKEWK